MKKLLFGSCLLVGLSFLSCTKQEKVVEVAMTQDSLIKRGAYLVSMMGCNDCHSPKVMGPMGPMPDTSRLLSGYPMTDSLPPIGSGLPGWILFSMNGTATVGPWGVSFSANLTPDDTGIASWTEEQFFKAMREGKFKGLDGTRPLLPPMPWPNYISSTDDDLRSIFTYLKSLKPVHNIVPAPISPGELM